jgi:MFS family permease
LGLSIYFFFFNLFLIGRGYTESELGFLTGTMAAGNLTGALPAGRLIRRVGLRNALIVCQIIAPVALGIRAVSSRFPLQLGLAFVTGMALSLWAVCISPTIAAITREHDRPLAFSLIFSSGIGLGAVGALAGSRMPNWFSIVFGRIHYFSPEQLTLITACGFALFAILPTVALRISKGPVAAQPRSLFTPALKKFLPAVAIWGLVTGSFSPFANVFLSVHLHRSLIQVGTVFSISQMSQVVTVLFAPVLFRFIGVSTGIFSTQIAVASCFIMLAFGGNPVYASGVYIVLTAFQWMSEPGMYSLLMKIVPEEHRGGASAAMTIVLAVSQLVAAAAAGWSFGHFGYPSVLAMIAAVAVVAGMLFKSVGHADSDPLILNSIQIPAD